MKLSDCQPGDVVWSCGVTSTLKTHFTRFEVCNVGPIQACLKVEKVYSHDGILVAWREDEILNLRPEYTVHLTPEESLEHNIRILPPGNDKMGREMRASALRSYPELLASVYRPSDDESLELPE